MCWQQLRRQDAQVQQSRLTLAIVPKSWSHLETLWTQLRTSAPTPALHSVLALNLLKDAAVLQGEYRAGEWTAAAMMMSTAELCHTDHRATHTPSHVTLVTRYTNTGHTRTTPVSAMTHTLRPPSQLHGQHYICIHRNPRTIYRTFRTQTRQSCYWVIVSKQEGVYTEEVKSIPTWEGLLVLVESEGFGLLPPGHGEAPGWLLAGCRCAHWVTLSRLHISSSSGGQPPSSAAACTHQNGYDQLFINNN